jgi:hypothetical protein
VTTLARPNVDPAGAIIWDLEDRLRLAHGENLALRILLKEHGVEMPAPAGVISLERMRRLEDIMDLAREYLFAETEDNRKLLWKAITDAGRAP